MDSICDAVGVGEDVERLQRQIAEELARLEKAAPRIARYRPKAIYAERPNYFYDAREAACWLAACLIGLRFADTAKPGPTS